MNDPTYSAEWINTNPVWKLVFELSEVDNDNAPIGWGRYINIARHLLVKYRMEERNERSPDKKEG